ncbi:MAG: protein-export chaperone SecB [Parvularculaceae bacterium]|nr:protein-export chaperone SecB [Parvularculaceae bacterium]
MSESAPNGAGGPPNDGPEAGMPGLRVLAQYLKDHSFENPRAPMSFRDNGTAPGIEVNVDVNARGLGGGQFEVELAVSARARRAQEVVFVVETTYAGVFEILNVPENQIEPILLIECPRLLFPFARQIVAETTTAGNFPPVMLDPIDFMMIYQRNVAARNGAEPQAMNA